MDIGIISPSPKPFAMGGIEKLMLGLYREIDQLTDHRVELIKLPTEENGFWELIKSYYQFYKLNVDHFDIIVSCKYPAWMVNHSNHTIYMAHHLRGLFDTYHFLQLPNKFEKTSYNEINEIIEYINNPKNIFNNLDCFFSKLFYLYDNKEKYPSSFFVFPGPFIRDIIHFLDSWALHTTRIQRYTSISNTVKRRKTYFPSNVEVKVIYPPTSLVRLEEGRFDYILAVGRLDGAKRIDLIIESMKGVHNPDIRLLIAGTGPEESKLKQIAASDARIEFVGYTNNDKLSTLYANALAVVYVPYDEDYGLVTIEAMKCGKPVITCQDSGGTTEFVTHEMTGLVAANNSKSLGKQIERLVNNVSFAETLGRNAKECVKSITWEMCIAELLDSEIRETITPSRTSKKRKKMTVLSTYPVFPRKHGGQLRIYNLYKNMDHEYDITIVSFNDQQEYYEKKEGNLTEISIPKSNKHIEKEWEIEREVGIPITDIAMKQLVQYSQEYVEVANKHLENADILVSAQPYLYELISQYKDRKYVIYDSQNVELELKKSMLPKNKESKKLLDQLFILEKNACSLSDLVFACSEEDRAKFTEIYQTPNEKLILIPNGVDTKINLFTDFEKRQLNKKKMGLIKENIIVFIGSWHKPNLEAVEEIIKIAPELPECKFIIMGGQCLAFKEHTPPKNVVLAGMIDEDMKQLIYSVADIALNPMINGSGTNLKVAEYMANGVPVISTVVGVRGYRVTKNETIIVSTINEIVNEITKLIDNQELREFLSENAYSFIKEQFDWRNMSNLVLSTLNET